jgi:cation-transporting ATPase G
VADACCADDTTADPPEDGGGPTSLWEVRDARIAAASGGLLAAGLIAGGLDASTAATVLFLAGLVVGGSTFIPDAVRALGRGKLAVATLMTIAAIGAVVLGEFGEAASLAFLFSISEALEGWALARTRRGLRALLALVPERVTVERDNATAVIGPMELIPGDVIVLAAGERLPTDGTVRAGTSVVDLSAITGESVPVDVGPDDTIFAGAVNGGGLLRVEATVATKDSSLARIVHLVEEAQERKAHAQRLAERIARPLVPAILIVATGIALVGSALGDPGVWVGRALVVLVAAAPCAFAISVPVTVVAAVGAASRMGVLIKGGAAVEALARVRVVALDKTGTLTRNTPTVIASIPSAGTPQGDLVAVAAALERHSDHPFATPIMSAASDLLVSIEADEVQAIAGNGITGLVDGRPARLGKPGFVDTTAMDGTVQSLQEEGATVVAVEHDGRLLGVIAVRDELRPEVSRVIERLRALGIGRIVMLTGDNQRTASALASEIDLEEVHAGLLPEDKVAIVDALQGEYGPVAMVGDGINDAPALATASVGIAMGAMGSDVAIEAADVALMGESLDHLADALDHAQRAGRIMAQNLALSALILVTLIPLAAFGVLGLAAVVVTHELAEVVVIANGVRAGRRRSDDARDENALLRSSQVATTSPARRNPWASSSTQSTPRWTASRRTPPARSTGRS